MNRVSIIGHDQPEADALRDRLGAPVICHEMLPRIRLWKGQLAVESPERDEHYLRVSHVVFHGIFEDDLPILSALALWGGPCFPRPGAMMDCRLRIPCLVRALEATRFGRLARGYSDRSSRFVTEGDCVAKWGEWHCGENKERFSGEWTATEPTLFEEFVAGEAVRVQLIGERAGQYRLGGSDWRRSIHHESSSQMPLDPELEEDARRLQRHFGLEIAGIDYMIARDGSKHLLEVNHIPTVTAFADVRDAYIEHVVGWLAERGIAGRSSAT
jgi:hypothetical protein